MRERNNLCGRFTITLTIGLPERFGVRSTGLRLEPRYNIAPSQPVPVVIRSDNGERNLVEMVWGLVPHWAHDPMSVHRAINTGLKRWVNARHSDSPCSTAAA